jgi:hypothetical protein
MTNTPDKQAGNRGEQTRWKPGESGNPKGRPRKPKCLTSLLKEELTKVNPEDPEGRTWIELIVLATLRLAMKGNKTALKEVWDRVDGKVVVPISTETTGPVEIRVVYEDEIVAEDRLGKADH